MFDINEMPMGNETVVCFQVPIADLEDEEDLEECFDEKQVLVGICAMAKKSESKPMKEILNRLDEFEYIKTIVFPEETILKVSQSSSMVKSARENCDLTM